MIHETTIIEMCYLISLKLGSRLSYHEVDIKKLEGIDLTEVYNVEGVEERFGQLTLDGELIEEWLQLDSYGHGNELIVGSDDFNVRMDEIYNMIRELHV